MNNIKNIKILDSINRELYITYNNNIFLKVESLYNFICLKEKYIFLLKRLQDHKHMVATISSN